MTHLVHSNPDAKTDSGAGRPALTPEQRSALAAMFYGAPRNWRQAHDRAIALLVLAEGMRPAEVAALRVAQARAWRPASAPGIPPRRRSRVTRQAVEEWLRQRGDEGIPGEQAFVRDERGARYRPSDVYRLIHRLLRKAGIDPRQLGRLRVRDCVRRKPLARSDRARALPRASGDRRARSQPTA